MNEIYFFPDHSDEKKNMFIVAASLPSLCATLTSKDTTMACLVQVY